MSDRSATTERASERADGVAPADERPRLLFFHSKLDGRSRRTEGYIAQVLQRRQNHGTFIVHHVEVGERPDVVQRFRIEQVPTLLVVANRRVQDRLTHPRGCKEIETMLKPWLR